MSLVLSRPPIVSLACPKSGFETPTLPLYRLASMTQTPDAAMAMWSMFARLRGIARSCSTTAVASRCLASSRATRSSPPAPRAHTCSCIGSSFSARSRPPMCGCLARVRCSRLALRRSCSRRALAPAVPVSKSEGRSELLTP